MKYLAIFLTMFVLALSIWPCCDDEADFNTQEIHASSVKEIPCDSNQMPHTCSPFFHCSTCQAFALTPQHSLITSAYLFKKNVSYPELPTPPVVLFAGDIWQPPQLV